MTHYMWEDRNKKMCWRPNRRFPDSCYASGILQATTTIRAVYKTKSVDLKTHLPPSNRVDSVSTVTEYAKLNSYPELVIVIYEQFQVTVD